ncbi:protein Wiz isoform X1 [Mesocricetus auratus]|uniref:Protein Wiz n=2 Tax=Mesocricetus auratus TaxID=10036 RepID=A0A1U8CRT6_MESAU|nr:protein Wiz isoform X1 [Mesocricetus auratus]XP_012978491.1 protein Wiz isoform X1 [Mesocricetus auratus]XP_040593584.1 protein Wiz isoform X1 [Mesocricetus auratus]
MEGLLAGGLAAPDRPRGPDRLPGPAPREDIDSGTEAAEGEGDIFRSAHYLPVTKEGPRDILDGRSGISDGQPHPGLSEALPRATSATHRISSCYWDGDSLDFQPGSPPPHLLGPFPASLDVQGSWEHPMVQEAGEGIQSEQRFEDSVIVRTMKPHAKLKVSRKFSNHRGELKFLEKYPPSHHKFDWLPDADKQGSLKDAGLHLDLPAKPPTVTSFRRVIVPVDDTPKTLDMEFMSTREDLEDFAGLTQPSEWGLHTSASEVATQTWTVNSEASVERLQPILPPVPTEPYLCELLQEVADGVDSREEEEEEEEEEPAVFPCIECSIYFRHKEHLLEHMSQHRRAPGQEPPAHLAPLACSECGWAFTEPTALEQHWQLHQASREKIIEEIQKLKRFPGDEGREARLQCPKCIFGTNSSRAFMQHAKLHVREILPGQQAKAPFRSSSPVIDISTLVYPSSGDSSGLDTCMYCGFRAPSKSLLGEHIRLVHAHWEEDGEAFEEILTSQPGTSQDARVHFPDTATTDYFGKSEPLLASVWQENPAGYDPSPAFGPDCHQPGVRDFPLLNSGQQPLGKLAFPSPAASASYPKPLNGSKSTVHLQRMGDKSHPWSDEEEEEDEGAVLTSEMDFTSESGAFQPPAIPSLIPQSALELKQTFQDALQAAEASQGQQQQLQGMVPIVLVAKLRSQVMAAASRASPKLTPEELGLGSNHPLDFLLLDSPLGGPLGLDTLLEGDPVMALKHEERKCPYCPDRFHNGIGLANHVRGHLNRVGVSYNVRHFISAEEVKAIERRFSFQKKKKKVANFDPGTFSLMRCDFCGAGFDTRAGLSSHARAHLRDFGITNWELTISPINILQELLATSAAELPPSPLGREPSGPPGSFLTSRRPRLPLTMPFPPTWAEDPGPIYGDGLCSEEKTMVAMDLGSPLLPKKSLPVSGALEQVASRLSSRVAAEVPHGSKQELPDLKAQSLTTCEVCGACFETRKGLSSHARSHLRQLGVAESESSGAPIDLLYELVKQKGLPDVPLGLPPSLTKKTNSPKELVAGAARPGLLSLAKPMDVPAVNKAIKSPPGFSAKGLVHASSSPLLKKVPLTLAGSPTPKNPEDKSPQLSLSPQPTSPKAQWSQSEDEGPLNLTLDSDGGRELDCQLCGAWFETRKGLSSHARAHLRHLGVSDPDAKGSPIDVLHGLIRRDGIQIRLPPGRGALAQLGRPPSASTALSLLPPPPPAKKAKLKASGMAIPWGKQDLSAAGIFWASDVEPSPLNLSSGPEPTRDIRCEFCGEFFENRKGLSSHARSHLRQMGVTEWYVNGSPIDTLREILKRRTQSRPGGHLHPPGPSPKTLAKVVGSGGPGSSLEVHSPSDLHISPLAKKLPPPPGSPLGHSPTASPPPTARKVFSGLATPSLPKKLKPEQMRVEIKREMLPGSLHGEPHPSEGPWGTPREDMAPLNLSSRAEPVRDIRCEFCGEFFENRKGLSSHARSHLRQMGVTEWSVNGSPIDTLREILKKKSKLCLIKKEPPAGDLAPALAEDGSPTAAPGAMHSPLPLSPLASRPGKSGTGPTQIPRELNLSPITGAKPSATSYLGPMATKRPLQEDRFLPAEVKTKTYIQTELPFKAKTLHEKTSHSSTEACCELCGLYFENRKALASHARAHLRQFGVTEWCVNGSPIETLSEWIKHRPQKAGAYRSYIQGGRPFTKKFRSAGHGRDTDKRPPLGLAPGGLSLVGRSAGGEPGPEAGRAADSGERPLATSPPGTVKSEEHQRQNINKFERRQARPPDASAARGSEEANDLQQKLEEVRQPPPRVRPVPSLVPRPPQTSLVKFVGNIYTLKCRFCEVEFQGPLSIQEDWVRHLQRHILEMNFSKADPPPEEPQAPQAQTAAVEAP